ncbi:unnamed protein product, partial [Polarella glacialis]
DKHVPDFLACLQCWLRRNLGDPRQTPWRLHRLDLSQNDLCDDSIVMVAGALRRDGVRVQRLMLGGNQMQARGVQALTEYAWDLQEAILEMDLADNEISVPPSASGDDPMSALLRCFYNHRSYPRRVAKLAGRPAGSERPTARLEINAKPPWPCCGWG